MTCLLKANDITRKKHLDLKKKKMGIKISRGAVSPPNKATIHIFTEPKN